MTSVNTNIDLLLLWQTCRSKKEMQSAMERLSSGLRINNAADDVAGSAIASKLIAQVKSLTKQLEMVMRA